MAGGNAHPLADSKNPGTGTVAQGGNGRGRNSYIRNGKRNCQLLCTPSKCLRIEKGEKDINIDTIIHG